MAFHFKNTNKDIIMTEKDEEDFKNKIIIVDFVKRKYYLIKLEINVNYEQNIEVQLIVNVILMLLKIKVISYHLNFTTLVFMIVICF